MESKKNALIINKLPFFYYLCPSFINEYEETDIYTAHIFVCTVCVQGWRNGQRNRLSGY